MSIVLVIVVDSNNYDRLYSVFGFEVMENINRLNLIG